MPAEIVRELHESSLALLESLRERSPHFLEHLERRQQAIQALKRISLGECDRASLEAALVIGDSIAEEAQHMRQEAVNGLSLLQSQRSYSRGLSSHAGHPAAALDVKA